MSGFENATITVIILLAPVSLCYGWFRISREPLGWRRGVTVTALALVSVAILAWPVRGALMPKADWASGVGVGEQIRFAEVWERAALRGLLVALVLGLFGRPRLIGPIVVACIGAALFWVFSTMP